MSKTTTSAKPLQNKIDFIAIVQANYCNPNGDPLCENRPRTDSNGFGIITDTCIKRKIRNRLQDAGYPIFVQMDERATDGYKSLADRAKGESGNGKDKKAFLDKANEMYMDVRSFGQVFAFSGKNSVSINVTGPVSLHIARSVAPVEIIDAQITKTVNNETSEKDPDKKASDTMGMKHFITHGLYVIKGAMNVQRAEKTGFSEDDANAILEALRTLFVNDATAARPDGSMEVCKLYVWRHNCKDGQYPSVKIHNSLTIAPKDPDSLPKSIEDYDIVLTELPGITPEVLDGI